MLPCPSESDYRRFTGPQIIHKATNELLGILQAVASDGTVTAQEVGFLQSWLSDHRELQRHRPFDEIVFLLTESLKDGVLTPEELFDLLWLCEKLTKDEGYFAELTCHMQHLHGLLGGIAADGVISQEELTQLATWMQEHEHLRRHWPFDEVDSLITSALADGLVDANEHEGLLCFIGSIIGAGEKRDRLPGQLPFTIEGICAMCPEIVFPEHLFCFTGKDACFPRQRLWDCVQRLGGNCTDAVCARLDYLVTCPCGNKAWAYSAYGRKVEEAMRMRQSGASLLIVHVNDFRDAVADSGGEI